MARTQQRTWIKASKLAKAYDVQARMIYEHVARTDFPMDAFRTRCAISVRS